MIWLHRWYLCPTSWYTLSSNEMVCNIWRMEGAFCLLYTLFLEIVYTVTRHQTTAIQHQQREKGGWDVAGRCLYTLLRWMQVYDKWQVTCDKEQDGRWHLHATITCTQSYLFHRKLEHISCFLFCCLLDGGCPLQTIADLTIVISLGLFPLYLN